VSQRIVDSLLSKRLVFLSGKGGVGKSLVGTALALAAQDRGRRVLLVEIDAPLEAARYLGSGPVGARPAEVLPGLSTVNLRPEAVMDEYVRRVVRVEMLVRRVLDSPVYRRFFAAAPGLPELMLLGKIMVLEEQREAWSRRPQYDVILVDAPATGHGLSFLKVPIAASEAIPVGPVGHYARKILRLLRDRRRTALAIVAIPEEMAVVEAAQFHRLAVDEVGMEAAAVFLNACHERRFPPAEEAEVLRLSASGAEGRLAPGIRLSAALAAARRHMRRSKLTRFYQSRLRKAIDAPLVSLPYLFEDEITLDAVRRLTARLEAA
jgi:anion-transporting  ArsA/GET3 family ATPase